MRYSANKDVNKLVRELIGEGWIPSPASGHTKLRTPCGRTFVIVSGSPGDRRELANLKRDIRRALRVAAAPNPRATAVNTSSGKACIGGTLCKPLLASGGGPPK